MRLPEYALDPFDREIEQTIILAVLRARDGTHWSSPAQLTASVPDSQPEATNQALHRLQQRGLIRVEADTITAPDSANQRDRLDALSAVVLHVLVSAQPQAMSVAAVAKECERDIKKPDERHEIELALRWIEGDGLAARQGESWIATRPAVRAAELSF